MRKEDKSKIRFLEILEIPLVLFHVFYNFDKTLIIAMKIRDSLPVTRHRYSCGFSLFEMLIVVAVIGILSSLIIQTLSGSLTDTVRQVHDRRNAQEIAGLATSAQAAQADFIEEDNLRATVENLIDGVEVTDGAFRDSVFRLENRLSEGDLTAALKFLSLAGGEVRLRIPGSGYRS